MNSALDEYMTTEAARIIKAAVEMWHCTHEVTVMGGTKSGESSPEMIATVKALAKTMPAFTNVMAEEDYGIAFSAGYCYACTWSVTRVFPR